MGEWAENLISGTDHQVQMFLFRVFSAFALPWSFSRAKFYKSFHIILFTRKKLLILEQFGIQVARFISTNKMTLSRISSFYLTTVNLFLVPLLSYAL